MTVTTPPTLRQLVTRSDDHPALVVPESGASLSYAALQRALDRAAGRLAALGVPSEVRLTLERQIDALDEPERELLVAASAVGMEFAAEAVRAGLGGRRSAAEIEECCDRLAREGALLRHAGTAQWPDGTLVARYRFTHEMYREVLYHRLVPARRAAPRAAHRLGAATGRERPQPSRRKPC